MDVRELRTLVAAQRVYSAVAAVYPSQRGGAAWVVLINGSVIRTVKKRTVRYFHRLDHVERFLSILHVRQFLVRKMLAEIADEVTL